MQDPQIVHRHGHSVLIDREGVARQGARIDKRGEGSASIYSYLCDGAASGEPGVAIFVMCNDRALVRRAVWQLHGGAPIRGHRIQVAPAIPQKHLIGVEVQSGRHAFKLLPVGREMRLNQLAHGGDGRGVAPAHHVFPCFGVQKVFMHRVGAETSQRQSHVIGRALNSQKRKHCHLLDVLQEVPQARVFRVVQEFGRLAIHGDVTMFHEDQPRAHLAGKCDFVGDHDHGHAILGQ